MATNAQSQFQSHLRTGGDMGISEKGAIQL